MIIFLGFLLIILFPNFSFAAGAADKSQQITGYETYITPALTNLIDQKLRQNTSKESSALIDQGLEKNPNDTALLYKKALIDVDIEQYDDAANALKKIQTLDPNNKKANDLFAKVKELQKTIPRNELGFMQDEAYVSDLNSVWAYSTMHYYRQTDFGKFGARINYADRFGTSAAQYLLEAYPKLFKGSYAELIYGYGNNTQILFPGNQYRVGAYFSLPHAFEVSLGQQFIQYQSAHIYTYTGSIGKYWGNYFFWFRPSSYVPRAVQLYQIGVRRYFADKNTFLSLALYAGKYPDIGNIVPLTQIIIVTATGGNLDGQIPLTKSLSLKLGVGYVKQFFLGNNTRKITDGSVGLVWRF